MSIHTPYNFVPLSRFIFLPNWADQVSHDIPFSDGVSGTLHIEMYCHTDTLIGGQQVPATDKEPGRVEFFKDPNGNPVIPGSSLKGALSNVLEIASFARFNRLEDKRYSVRDLSTAGNFYFQQFGQNSKNSRAGWLKYHESEGCWKITPCKMARILQKDIIKACSDISETRWTEAHNAKAHQRYELLRGFRSIQFNTEKHKNKGTKAVPEKNGQFEGKIVVTGQPGKAFNDAKGKINKNKKWEFVFYAPASESKAVPLSVIRDFKFIHSESDDWKYWEQKKAAYKDEGIPVFYMENGTQISSLGLSFLYKLAYKNTTHDAVKHTQVSHLDSNSPDLPALIFGQIGQDENSSLRGRINIGAAILQGEARYNTLPTTILNGPKPTYYPAYVRQDKGDASGQLSSADDYSTLMDKQAELSGWKRYQTQDGVAVSRLETDQLENTKVQVKLVPIKSSACFTFKVHFHNLREAELGALLWSLDFGGKDGAFHNIGMGKPFGMGRVAFKVVNSNLYTNHTNQLQNEALLEKTRFSFTHLMETTYSSATDQSWKDSPQLQELFAMATPTDTAKQPYMKLDQYTDSTKANNLNVLQAATGDTFNPLDIPSDINFLSNDEYASIRAEKRAAEEAAQEVKEREELKASAPEEIKQVLELEDLIKKHTSSGSKSSRQKLNKQMQKMAKPAFLEKLEKEYVEKSHTLIQPLHSQDLPDTSALDKLQRALNEHLGKTDA